MKLYIQKYETKNPQVKVCGCRLLQAEKKIILRFFFQKFKNYFLPFFAAFGAILFKYFFRNGKKYLWLTLAMVQGGYWTVTIFFTFFLHFFYARWKLIFYFLVTVCLSKKKINYLHYILFFWQFLRENSIISSLYIFLL